MKINSFFIGIRNALLEIIRKAGNTYPTHLIF